MIDARTSPASMDEDRRRRWRMRAGIGSAMLVVVVAATGLVGRCGSSRENPSAAPRSSPPGVRISDDEVGPLTMIVTPAVVHPGGLVALVLEGDSASEVDRDPFAFLEACENRASCELVTVLSAEGFPGFTAGGEFGALPIRATSRTLRFRLPADVPFGCYQLRHHVYDSTVYEPGGGRVVTLLVTQEASESDQRDDIGSTPTC